MLDQIDDELSGNKDNQLPTGFYVKFQKFEDQHREALGRLRKQENRDGFSKHQKMCMPKYLIEEIYLDLVDKNQTE